MKQAEAKNGRTDTSEALTHEIERLHQEVNEIAMRLCACQSAESHNVWLNLANARAHLATALENSRQLKDEQLRSFTADWQI